MTRDEVIQAVARLQLVHGSHETFDYVDIDIDEDGWVDLGPGLDQGLGRRPLPLTPGEVAALSAAVRALAEGPAAAMARDARGVLDKIVALAGAPVREALARIDARIAVGAGLGVSDPLWTVVLEGLRTHRELEIEYLTASRDELTLRTVRPWSIVGREGYWYLHAYCLARGEGRVFRLDRIVTARVTATSFVPPPPGTTTPEPTVERVTDRQRPDIEVRFDAAVADWVRERHPDRPTRELPDGAIAVSLPWQSQTFLAGWVLSFSGRAVVLAPQDMRRLVRDRLRAAFPEALDAPPLPAPDPPPWP
jgi:proteasome accessory factor C